MKHCIIFLRVFYPYFFCTLRAMVLSLLFSLWGTSVIWKAANHRGDYHNLRTPIGVQEAIDQLPPGTSFVRQVRGIGTSSSDLLYLYYKKTDSTITPNSSLRQNETLVKQHEALPDQIRLRDPQEGDESAPGIRVYPKGLKFGEADKSRYKVTEPTPKDWPEHKIGEREILHWVKPNREVFLIGEIHKDLDGTVSMTRPSNPLLPFTIAHSPAWGPLQDVRSALITQCAIGTFLSGLGLLLSFSGFFYDLRDRMWRMEESTDLYRIRSRIVTSSSTISIQYRILTLETKLHASEVRAFLEQSAVPHPDQPPSSIEQIENNVYIITYLRPCHKSLLRQNLLRFFSLISFSIAATSLINVIQEGK